MDAAVGQVLAFAVAVAISPVPIIAVTLMLATPRARTCAPGFLLGWVVGLSVVGTAVLVIAGSTGDELGSSDGGGTSWTPIVLGVLLLALAGRQWRDRPRPGEEATLPGWMQKIDDFTFARSVSVGVALSAINPKNLLLTIGAASAIAETGVDAADEAVAMAVFVVIGTLGAGIPVAAYFLLGERAENWLAGLKAWMGEHSAAIMTVLLAVIGAKLIGDGLAG